MNVKRKSIPTPTKKKQPFSSEDSSIKYSCLAFSFHEKTRVRCRLRIAIRRVDGSTSREELELRRWSLPLRAGACAYADELQTFKKWNQEKTEPLDEKFFETFMEDNTGHGQVRIMQEDGGKPVRFGSDGPLVQKLCPCKNGIPGGFPVERQHENLECCDHPLSFHGGPDFNALYSSALVLTGGRSCSVAISFAFKHNEHAKRRRRNGTHGSCTDEKPNKKLRFLRLN